MSFQFIAHTPSQPVAAMVETIWYAHGRIPYRRERILPNGRPVLIVNLGAPFLTSIGAAGAGERLNRDAWVVGPSTRFLANQPLRETHVVGVTFRPWGAGPLLSVLGDELRDYEADADCFWRGGVEILRQRLAAARDPRAKIGIMETALRDRLSPSRDPGLATAVYAARRLDRPEAPRIGTLSAELDISRKHLNALFSRHVGLSPKAFSRLRRFNRAVATLAAGRLSLDEIALAHEYYDQAHFNRDFAAFSGLHPTAYRARRRQFLADGEDPSGLFVPEG